MPNIPTHGPAPVQPALELVRSYHRAWTTDKNLDTATECLSETLQTELPLGTYETKAEYVEAIGQFGELVSSVRMIAELATEDAAFLLYDVEMSPIGTLRMAEYFEIADGKITSIRLVNDTAGLRAAGFAPPLAVRT